MKQRLLDVAEVIDAHRVFPKIFMVAYFLLIWKVGVWFMLLDKPGAEQSAFVTVVTSSFAPLLNWYFQTGRRWTN
jgi:hypothetical protein